MKKIVLIAVVVLSIATMIFPSWQLASADDNPCNQSGSTPTSALSGQDCAAIVNNWPNWKPDSGNSAGCGGDTTLIGSDPAAQTWNYFKGKGLDDLHVAAIMGNFKQESSFNSQILQIGGTSQNPADAGSGGYGLAQWTPGAKLTGIAASYNITTPVYELLTQLNIVWAEMNQGPTPTGYNNFLTDFNKVSDLPGAVQFMVVNFEGPSVVGPRLQDAQDALTQYGSGAGASAAGSCTSVPPDCSKPQTVTGVAKIYCAALKYDTVSYVYGAGHNGAANWLAACPAIGPSCAIDCSGLVDVAVYDAFGNDTTDNAAGQRSDTQNWEIIPLSKAIPGDLIQPDIGHVEIIGAIHNSVIYTFGAHQPYNDQTKDVGPSNYSTTDSGNVYLHYIGPGV